MIKILKSKSLWINIVVAIIFVVILFNLLLYGLDVYTRHGEKIPVPNLYGLDLEEAKNLLDEKGLRVTVLDSLYDETKPGNSVLEQLPDTGAFVKDNRMIYIRINKGQTPVVAMPDLDGMRIQTAQITLESLGLRVGRVDTIKSIQEDAVLEQKYKGRDITPDTKVPQGSVIDLVIGDGETSSRNTPLPQLLGSTVQSARIYLEEYGLELGVITASGPISDTTRAVIISQSPPYVSDTKVPKGTAINITIEQ